jgi:probable rRNA maturation factor
MRRGCCPSANGRITIRRLAATHGISTRDIVRAVRAALADRPCRGLSVVVVDDEQISRLHGQFMGDPSPTDVLAFDLRDRPADEQIEGEVIVSSETACRQGRCFRADPGQELLRYVIHGTLHLVGSDDQTPTGRRKMRREENRILSDLAAAGAGRRQPKETRSRPLRKQRAASGV